MAQPSELVTIPEDSDEIAFQAQLAEINRAEQLEKQLEFLKKQSAIEKQWDKEAMDNAKNLGENLDRIELAQSLGVSIADLKDPNRISALTERLPKAEKTPLIINPHRPSEASSSVHQPLLSSFHSEPSGMSPDAPVFVPKDKHV